MSEKTTKWAKRAGVATASVALIAAGIHVHNQNEVKRKVHTPAIAGPILADRLGSCALAITDTHKPAQSAFLRGKDTIAYTVNETIKPAARPYYAAFVDNDGVLWNNALITRAYNTESPKMKPYTPLPTMGSANWNESYPMKDNRRTDKLDPNATGNHTDGVLVPQMRYGAGSFVDIWSNESTVYRNEDGDPATSVSAIYCGRMVMEDVAGVLTWQLDKTVHRPSLEANAHVVRGRLDTLEQEKALLPLRVIDQKV